MDSSPRPNNRHRVMRKAVCVLLPDPPPDDQSHPGYEPDADEPPDEDEVAYKVPIDSDANMPSNRQRNPLKREVDMSAILSPAQKADFNNLVEAIIEKMSAQVQKAFDFLHLPVAQKGRVQIWNYGPAMEAALTSLSPAAAHPANGIRVCGPCIHRKPTEEQDRAKIALDESPSVVICRMDADSVEAAVPSMSELQKDVNSYFLKWKTTFLKRLNELVVPKFANPNAGRPGHAQGPPRGAGAGAGAGVGAGPSGRPQQPHQVNRGIAYQADLHLIRRFPPAHTPLTTLDVDKRRLLLHSMILVLLSTEHYIAYSRIFLLYLASSLHIPMRVLVEDEERIAQGLGKIYKTLCDESREREIGVLRKLADDKKTDEGKKLDDGDPTDTADAERHGLLQEPKKAPFKTAKESKSSKRARPATNLAQAGTNLLAAGIGAVPAGQGLPAVSLPPVTVANLLGALGGDNNTALATFFGASPIRPSVKSIDSFSLTLQDIGFVPLHGSKQTELRDQKHDVAPEDRRMRLVLCVNGLVTEKEGIVRPWKRLGPQNEVYSIRWETESLEKIGSAFDTLLNSKAWTECRAQLNPMSIVAKLLTSDWPAALLRASKIIDNAWIMGMTRSTKLHSCLSEFITGHLHGERGLTLIGFGVGARAIYLTLSYLAERKLYGLVDSVVLMGAPIPSDSGTWSALKSAVVGRLVNVFADNDYMLAFAARTGPCQFGVAGLSPVQGVGGVENHNVSDILEAHVQYPSLIGDILQRIGWDDLNTDTLPVPRKPVRQSSTAAQNTLTAVSNRHSHVQQIQGRGRGHFCMSSECKENTQPLGRGGKCGRNNIDKRLAGRMRKMRLE